MTPLAPRQALAYACPRRLGNAKPAATHSVNVLFSCPKSAQDSGCQSVPIIGRLAGVATRKGASCSGLQFPNPASLPAKKPGFNQSHHGS